MDETETKQKIKLKNMSLPELETYLTALGEPKFRAKQVFTWIHRGVTCFEEMTDLSVALREKLALEADLDLLVPVRIQASKQDGTRKYLFRLADGALIESVLMKYQHGNSICISSQAGCRMGCRFCASTLNGLERDLTAAELLEQILAIERDAGEKVSNVVVMGTGEPFDNYQNLSRFLQLIHAKEGKNFSYRSITVSTCGLVPRMLEFARDFPQVNLAVSLHGPNDEIRGQIMPINKSYSVEEVIQASRQYVALTGRRITFEYSLMRGINDSSRDAKELAKLLAGLNCHVNLIPLNAVKEAAFQGTDRKEVSEFQHILEQARIQVTVRRELGSDIDAACGQLRLNVSG